MPQCDWANDCEEPATIRLRAIGQLIRTEELCVEHASRERDNLIAAGCTVTLTQLPPPRIIDWDRAEDDLCQKLTAGCSIDHTRERAELGTRDGNCEPW